MQIGIKILNDVAILEVSGNLSGGSETSVLHSKVKELIADDICNVVVDLKYARWINSIAIGVLLGCYTSLSRENGMIKLANVSDKINQVLEITHLTPFLKTYQSVMDAVGSFNTIEHPFNSLHHTSTMLEHHQSKHHF